MFEFNLTLGLGLVVTLGTAIVLTQALRAQAERSARRRLVPVPVRAKRTR
jgi:hypothetical protein